MKLAWLPLFGLVSCAPPPPSSAPHFWGDTVLEAPSPARQALSPQPDAAGSVLYVNFLGDAVQHGSSDDATQNLSVIAGGLTQIPPFNSTVNAPKIPAGAAQTAVFDRLRTFYLPFAITLTRTRPASGSYTMILVGGTHTLVGEPTGVAGVSPLDCTNANPSNVVFDFSDDQPPDYGGVVSVAITAAHESGHSFGLEHTDDPNDIMFSVDPKTLSQTLEQLFTLSFTEGGSFSGFNAGSPGPNPESCGRGNPVNRSVLGAALGTRALPPKPSLSWDFPPASAQNVPLAIPLAFTPSAGSRVEVYKNLELVAVLTAPPYTTSITAADKEAFYLTAEAIDANASRTTASRTFLSETKNPALCTDSSTCPAGRSCKDAYCRLPLGSSCKSSLDCLTSFCKTVGGAASLTCTQVCNASNPCPAAGTCTGGLCVPTQPVDSDGGTALKNEGDACTDGTECASGRCQAVCVAACDDQTACVTGTCMDVGGGRGCVGGTPPGSGGCVFGGRAPAPLALGWMLALVACGCFARRRRRA